MTFKRTITTALLALLPTLLLRAGGEQTDSVFQKLYNNFFSYYSDENKEKEFFETSEQLQQYFLDRGKKEAYYRVRFNEILYMTEHNHPYRAILHSNQMLEDMKSDNVNKYDIVYSALGTIFESRGNTRMAKHYYTEALDFALKNDTAEVMGIYARLANLSMLHDPDEAAQWNEKLKVGVESFPPYHKVYLTISGIIHFAKNDKQGFLNDYRAFNELKQSKPNIDDYGDYPMEVIKLAFDGKYQQALSKLNNNTADLTIIDRYNMIIKVYQMMGNDAEAIRVTEMRANARDSLNSDMIFDNLNEINAEMNVAKMKQESAEERVRYFIIITTMLLLVILFLVFWMMARRRARKQLIEKNAQLETALNMAQEASQMKASFIRNVTHEIRTPLNAINGFTQLLNNPEFELNEEEKRSMTETIRKNVDDITQIVDEILQMADKESNSHYNKNDTVNCNSLMAEILHQFDDHLNPFVTLRYESAVDDGFTIQTNESALRRIVSHLLDNAVKFTLKGTITLSCELSTDQKSVIISVTDTGIGIPEDKQDLLFTNFFKVDAFSQGIGLGLSVSQMIAQKLYGNIAYDKNYKDGSRFVVTMPTA